MVSETKPAPRSVCLPPATVSMLRELIARYFPDKEIADRLGVKIDSVRWYRRQCNRRKK
jgi:FixJ family two-component response regulator